MTAASVEVLTHPFQEEPLLGLEGLADAATRLPRRAIEHHLGDLPVLLPDGAARRLPLPAADIIRALDTSGCWVMLARLERLPAYRSLVMRAFRELSLFPPGGEGEIGDLQATAFLAAPRARVPVHFDKTHGVLLQIRGTKVIWTGDYCDPTRAQYELERRLGPAALNASAVPEKVTRHDLSPGLAVTLPAFTFHWVEGGDEVSISLSIGFATRRTEREVRCHRVNARLRQLCVSPSPPGLFPRRDKVKSDIVRLAEGARRVSGSVADVLPGIGRYRALHALTGALAGDSSATDAATWRAAAALAEQHGLAPALWVAIRADQGAVPADLVDHLRNAHLANVARNMLLRRQLEGVLERLGQAQIRVALMKGALYLVRNPFSDPGERVMADLDVLVDERDTTGAVKALRATGYEPHPRPAHEQPHELRLMSQAGPAVLELHARIGQPSLERVLPTAAVWANAVPVPGALGLSPTDAIVHNVLHAQIQDRGHVTVALALRQLHTMVSVATSWRDEIDWTEVTRRFQAAGRSRELRSYLHLATKLLDWSPSEAGTCTPDLAVQAHTAAVVASAALGWPSDVAYNLGNAFDATYLDALYRHGGRPAALALARARHLGRLARQRGRGAFRDAVVPHR